MAVICQNPYIWHTQIANKGKQRQQWLRKRPLTLSSHFTCTDLKKPSLLPDSAVAGWVWSLEIVQILRFWPRRGCSGSRRCHREGMRFPCAGTSLANTRYPSFLPAPIVGIIAFGFFWL